MPSDKPPRDTYPFGLPSCPPNRAIHQSRPIFDRLALRSAGTSRAYEAPLARPLVDQRACDESFEVLERGALRLVDGAERAAVLQIAFGVERGDERLSVVAELTKLPFRLLTEKRRGIDFGHELRERVEPRLCHIAFERLPGSDRRLEIVDALAYEARGVDGCASVLDGFVQAFEQRCVRTLALDCAADVEAKDVVGALPEGVDLCVAKDTGDRPGLDVAVAAVDLDGVGGGRDAETSCFQLDQGRDDANPSLSAFGPLAVGVAVAVEDHRLHAFDIHDHLGQLAAHERVIDESLLPGVTRFRVAEGFDECPTGAAEAHHGDAQACEVRHRHQA